jgi:hypothetical protein
VRILIPLLAACLLTGCTHVGAVVAANDGDGVWVATNSTYFGIVKEYAIVFCEKDWDDGAWACTKFAASSLPDKRPLPTSLHGNSRSEKTSDVVP